MKTLADHVAVEHRSARSVNVEQELDSPSPLDGFIATEQVLDGVRRLLAACEPGPRIRAWSVTGPYGAGKSSFAHFLCGLVGRARAGSEPSARRLLKKANPDLARQLTKVRRAGQATDLGFIRAAATAAREPVSSTLARALYRGAEDYWGGRRGRRPDVLHDLHAMTVEIRLRDGHPDPRIVLDALEDLIAVAPVLLVVDELGKALEYAADGSREADLYLLQQIAERFSSSEEMSGCFLALQHLAFEDYASGLSPARRREWRKIQGRFDDVAFTGGAGHAAKLIGASLVLADAPKGVKGAMRSAKRELLAVAPEVRSTLDALGDPPSGYPLHPTVIPALADLAGRFGQHDRSLMAFLTGDAPDALPTFLRSTPVASTPSFVRLPEIYDYYVDGAASLALVGEEAVRLREIRGRISEATSVSDLERRCLKTIGVLNLVGHGRFAASAEIVVQAVAGPSVDAQAADLIRDALRQLEHAALITHRDFANEYRVWQGSDFDVAGAIAEQREQVARDVAVHGPPIEQIALALPPRPLVARRHSQRVEVLRYFEARYEAEVPSEPPACERADSDGLVLYVLAAKRLPKTVPSATIDGRPLVLLATAYVSDITGAAVDAAAGQRALQSARDLEDVVALAELRHRAALMQVALSERVEGAFDPRRRGVKCFAAGQRVAIKTDRDFSEVLSRLCDETYHRSPVIRTEMLNRRELTSQGAKSRRELLERMFEAQDRPRLGISGFGPDRAMYESVLAATGIHREREGTLELGAPDSESGLAPAWDAINRFLDGATEAPMGVDQLYDHLMAPPYGMKEGPIPVLLAAVLICRADDIFVFEEGTFLPRLAPEHLERLVKTPDRFAVKRAASLGVRAGVFRNLQLLVGGGSAGLPANVRNPTTLAVVRPLIAQLQALPEYSRNTSSVSASAQRVRNALATTTEPDELLFSALPAACGAGQLADDSAEAYVSSLKRALDELSGAYDVLLDRLASTLREAFATRGPDHALREDLRSRARHLFEHVIDRRLRSFLLMAANEELDDLEWLEAIATVLAQKPPGSWSDTDIAVFESAVLEVARPFRRLELLHLQMADTQQEGFSARRLTTTEPDGNEKSGIVWLQDSHAQALAQVLNGALEQAAQIAGGQAPEGLLALLAERVLADHTATTEADDETTMRGRAAR